jgi:putative protein kinase ArgK-like GTPase of G3E family
VAELLDTIEQHRAYLTESSREKGLAKKRARVRDDLAEMIKSRLVEEVMERLLESGAFDRAVDAVTAGKTDPYSACDDLLLSKLGSLK